MSDLPLGKVSYYPPVFNCHSLISFGIRLFENNLSSLFNLLSFRDLIRDFDEHNWNTEFDLVMSNLFTALNMGVKWKDYRAMSIMRTKKHS